MQAPSADKSDSKSNWSETLLIHVQVSRRDNNIIVTYNEY